MCSLGNISNNKFMIFIVLLIGSQSNILQPFNQPYQKFVWFNQTHSDTPFSSLFYPNGGFAQYYTKKSYSNLKKESVQKQFFNLYDGYSQFWNLMAIICQPKMFQNICKNIQFQHSLFQMSQKQANFGSLVLDDTFVKIIKLKDKSSLKFYERVKLKETIQYIITVLIIICVVWSLFAYQQIKLVNQNFYLQNLSSSLYLIVQGGQYAKQAIQNWSNQSWKFWIFIPLIIFTYKILEDFVYKIMTGNINLKPLLFTISLNLNIYYWGTTTFIFPIISSMFIFCCNLQSNQQSSSIRVKKQQQRVQKIGLVFMLINLKILFKKQSCYMLTISPQYFIVGMMIMFTIFMIYCFKNNLIKKKQQYEQNKLRIKIIVRRSQLVKQMGNLQKNQIINQECSICYQKIQQNWAKTPCNHYFHDYCLSQWLQKSQTCPIDRQKILSNQPKQMRQSQIFINNQ